MRRRRTPWRNGPALHRTTKEPFPERICDGQFGVNVAATEWLANKGVVHFGIDSMRPGPMNDVNLLVHKACLDLDITHIESLCNLVKLLGEGPFTFIGLPMKWRNGSASPIWAVAMFDLENSITG